MARCLVNTATAWFAGRSCEKMFGPVLYEAFREVKRAFDPQGMFNPGKIVDTPPLTANLRYGAGYRTPDPVAYFDYSDHGGLGGAVEMCSGLGVCRKQTDGTMCPSYMATLEEKHSTRGRANTLRLAMAGRLAAERLDDHDVYEVLDLCLECRACKAECPVGVDVGRFKSEFLAQYWKEQGVPLGVKMIGNISTLLSLGSRMPSLTNLIGQSTPARWLAESLFGIDRRRPLPRLAPRTFLASFERAGASMTRTQHPAPTRTGTRTRTRHPAPAPSTQHSAPSTRAIHRHVHEFLPPRHRPRRSGSLARLQSVPAGRAARVLWTSADFERAAGRGTGAGEPKCRRAVRRRGGRPPAGIS